MIVDRIRDAWRAAAARRSPTGTPSGSRWGTCTAQLEQMMYPTESHPEPIQPRGLGVMDLGTMLHDWLAHYVDASWPGRWGLREQPFYLRVPIPPAEVAAGACEMIRAKLRPRCPTKGDDESWRRTAVWGWPESGFSPPRIEVVGDRRLRIGGNLGASGSRDGGSRFAPSVVLDMQPADGAMDPCVWVRCDIDGLIMHPDLGLTLVEVKSMSDGSFRRAAAGDLEYGYQCQLVGAMEAIGVQSAVWILIRKQTCHLAEISFAASASATRVTFTASSGVQQRYIVVDAAQRLIRREDSGDVEPYLADSEWETADVWTPALAAERVLPDIRRRILRALTAQSGGARHREYGPEFRCPRCAGAGTRRCAYCQGTGVSVRSGKACGACGLKGKHAIGLIGRLACTPTAQHPSCGGSGQLDVAALPWQCSYCPVALTCYAPAGVRRVLEGGRPRLLIDRAAWEASGLTFESPTPPEIILEDDAEEEQEV